ncbi:MAG: gliding motility-associated C-terminal domain-containing protein [Flavobacteriales bacterium]|nr:gliding motility-associated C-terminal domain-containing protein [Flavobacteriales bacterium]
MLKTIKYSILLSLMVLYSSNSYATHAAGMDITYQCVGSAGGGSGVQITVTINTQSWGNEISWDITTSAGVVVASGSGYSSWNSSTSTFCVPTGSLNFNMYDSYGDGWNGGTYSITGNTSLSGTTSGGLTGWTSFGTNSFSVSGGTPCTIPPSSQYLITVKFYRDCGGISAPSSFTLNYSSASCGQSGSATLSQVSGGQEITPICPSYTTTCQNSWASITGIQEYTYQTTITLPSQCPDWVLSVCECCRNGAITTISGSPQLCVEAVINNTASVTPCNNSPTFSVLPVPFICNGMTYCYNNGATDVDGDSLVYSLVTPLTNTGTVNYLGGYSTNNPAGGTTMFDPVTGNLCLTTVNTLVTVIAIKVSEYRNGVLIGSVIRDIQVNVINCSNNSPLLSGFGGNPTNVNNSPTSADYTFCADGVSPINLTINGSDPNATNNLTMVWNNSIPGATFNVSGNNTNSPIGTFSWVPTAANASNIPYYFTVSVSDDACPINASFSYAYSITISANPDAGISNNISVCETDPPFNLFAQLGGSPTGGGSWYDSNSNITTNSFDPSTDSSGVFTYVLDSAGNCPGDSATITVNVTPPPNAGTYGAITVCTADPIFDLFLQLGGTPLSSGNWTDSGGNSVSNLFDPSSMSSGTFTYTVQGAGTCASDTATITVIVNTSPTATLSVNSPTCSGDSVTLNLSFTGQGPFTSTITDGNSSNIYNILASGVQTNGQSVSFNPTSTTTYAITSIADQTACLNLNPIMATVNVIQPPNAGIGGSVSACTNDSIIDLTTYLSGADTNGIWTDPSNNTIINIFNPNTQTGGIYTYTVSASPCPNDISTINVTVNSPPNVMANANPSTICVGDPTTLTGSGASTYSWNNGITDGVAFNPTSTTTYTVTGTDVNNCVNTDMITVTVNTLPNVVANANPSTICVGDPTTLTGSGASTYSWNNGITDGVAFNPTSTTTYTVTGTDVNGCIDSNQITVNVNSIPAASLSGTQNVCIGNSATLNFNLIGNPPFTVNFNDSTSFFTSLLDINGNLLAGDPISFSPLLNTPYYITNVSDANSCTNTASGSELIIVNPLPTASISGATTICAGTSTPLNFSVTGAHPFLLNYSDGTSNFNITLDSLGVMPAGQLLVSPTTNTTYTLVDITDNNTCFDLLSDTTQISVIQSSSAGINATAPPFCANDIATNMILLLGGNPATTGVWTDPSGNTVSNMFDPSTSTPGTYIYTVTAAPCPTTSANLNIIVNSLPTATISGLDTICTGESSDLSFLLTGLAPFNVDYTNGTNNYNVDLDANGNNVLSGSPITHTPLLNTNYTILGVTDANGCTNSGNGIAEKIVNPLPNLSISGTNAICIGDSSTLNFNILVGAAPFTVNLNDGASTSSWQLDINGNVNGAPLFVKPNNTTTYTLLDVTDANNCVNNLSGNATITINALPTALISGTTTICEGENTPISFTLQNGLSPYSVSYKINGTPTSDNFNISGVNTLMVNPTTTTTYALVDITDANNCYNTANDSATIDVNEKVDATMSGGGDICNDGSKATIDIITNDSTSVNVTYTNGFMPTTLSGIGPFEINTNQAETYMITDVVDIFGCKGTFSGNATITVNPLPLAEFSFFPQPTDLDNPHINFINSSFGHTASFWDFGDGLTLNDTISKLIHTYQDTGHYRVNLAVSNQFGCTDTISYTIIIDPVFIIYIPNAFTPNADNINNSFGPSVYGIKEFEMKIYDRWGGLIYITDDENKPWNGTINGNKTQSGVYSYAIIATDLKDKPHKFVGYFTLLR